VRTFAFEEGGYIGHYIGGYSDWAAQREPEEKETVKKKDTVQRKPKQKKLKFTYKEEKEYETIEEDIASLEERIADIETQMNSCGADYGKLADLHKEKDELEEQLLYKMERWEYLEHLAARIDAGEMVDVE
jgi:ATP-binding cassette subfamily F protein uup